MLGRARLAHELSVMLRRPRVLLKLALALCGLVPSSVRASPPEKVPVHEVEAEFIERFTRFIEWPDSVFKSPSAPFVLCTWGGGPLSAQLEQGVSRRRIKARAVRLLRVDTTEQLAPCHVLYLAVADRGVVRRVSAYSYGKPLLSVGDQPGMAEAGLLINLVVDDGGFVRFEINRDVAKASTLKISAKLMRLARLVGGRR